jgi:hypothetical protein
VPDRRRRHRRRRREEDGEALPLSRMRLSRVSSGIDLR